MSLAENPGAQPPKTTPSRYDRLIEAFRFPDIRTLWVSTISNQLGQGMQQVVLGWLVLEMTGSGGMVGAIFAVRSAPNLIVGLAAGSITDRLDRRALMRFSLWGTVLTTLTAAFLLFTNQLTVWQLMLITFVLGTLQAFYMTARQVYVYDVVGSGGAVNGIALISLAQRLGQVFGALLAGWLIQRHGSDVSFLVMGLSYAFGALTLYALRHAGAAAPLQREPMLENILNYFRALRSNRVMLSLIISTAAAEILGFSHQVILPILAIEVLQVGAVGLGILTAFRFVGGALGVAALAVMGQVRRRGVLLLAALALFGIAQMLLGQSASFLTALALVTLVNVMAAITDVLHQSLLQLSVSNEQRGRAMGSWIVGIGTAPVGQLQIGYLSELTNARMALLVNGVALAVLALIMGIALPRLRRL
jgi:MFS family permease